MICAHCLRSLRSSSRIRTFSTTSARLASPIQTTPQPSPAAPRSLSPTSGAPAATSIPAVAQPFSTPYDSRLPSYAIPPAPKTLTGEPVQSSVAAGTVLKGLGFLKGKDPPLAMEDAEYPPWLWGILDRKEGGSGEVAGGDEYSKSKKQRRAAAKAQRRLATMQPETLVPKVPIDQQSIDLPTGDGSLGGAIAAARARDEVRDQMRGVRRKKIQEGNFLRGMR